MLNVALATAIFAISGLVEKILAAALSAGSTADVYKIFSSAALVDDVHQDAEHTNNFRRRDDPRQSIAQQVGAEASASVEPWERMFRTSR
jgi:hypothetical protein